MIYGEEDTHVITQILRIAKESSGVLRRIDNIFIRVQPVYAGNVAAATLQAKNKVQSDPSVGGEHFFISDDTRILDPFEFAEPYVKARGYKISERAYSLWIFLIIFAIYSWVNNLIGSIYTIKFPGGVTSRMVRFYCTTYFFNRTKATLRLEYEPLYQHEEAEARSLAYYKKVPL